LRKLVAMVVTVSAFNFCVLREADIMPHGFFSEVADSHVAPYPFFRENLSDLKGHVCITNY